ncbi:gustatory receptor for sugar taste 43a-like [Schistocerca gregaria]|uniref:gustatory receptor for sugar taste 43a-like n=1 Tax=Schistocerca gregaria TaxID=7010 RepID=UPI00211EAC69|nr:gustatory receptor for sugar taste 43a-like [Schistocerca gregaria]
MVHTLFESMITLQFVCLVLELWERFRTVNASLRESLPPLRAPEMRALFGGAPPSPPPARPGGLRRLREAYVASARAAELLQRHFGWALAVEVAYSVAGALCSSYEIVRMAAGPRGRVRLALSGAVSTSALWLAYHCLRLAATSLACAAAAAAAADTGVLLLRAWALSDWRSAELDRFLRLALHGPPLRFTAAGLVRVDRRLLVSAIAVVVTYLVVLSQH